MSVNNNATFTNDVSINALTLLNNVSANNISTYNLSSYNLSVKGVATFTNDVSMNATTLLNNVSANNLSTYNLSVKGNATFAYDISINGQTTFYTPPHVPDPIYGNDAASKGYVDSLVGQYSGGLNLFFNYNTVVDTSGRLLAKDVSDSLTQLYVDISNTNTTNYIQHFISDQLGITQIPTGIFSAFIYGSTNDPSGLNYYYFELYTKNVGGTETYLNISSSNTCPDINETPIEKPSAYNMFATITSPIAVSLTDRLVIKL